MSRCRVDVPPAINSTARITPYTTAKSCDSTPVTAAPTRVATAPTVVTTPPLVAASRMPASTRRIPTMLITRPVLTPALLAKCAMVCGTLCTKPVIPTTVKATRSAASLGPMNMNPSSNSDAADATATNSAGPIHSWVANNAPTMRATPPNAPVTQLPASSYMSATHKNSAPTIHTAEPAAPAPHISYATAPKATAVAVNPVMCWMMPSFHHQYAPLATTTARAITSTCRGGSPAENHSSPATAATTPKHAVDPSHRNCRKRIICG